jgi:hypothetical protein
VVEYLGWAATAVFVGSYFCTRPETLRRVQMAAAVMWIAYGIFIQASPVVVANILVFTAGAWTLGRSRRVEPDTAQTRTTYRRLRRAGAAGRRA